MKSYLEGISFISQLLKGFSQIMLQDNSLTGFFIVIGIFIGNLQCGMAAVLATTAGTLWAHLSKYDQTEINNGLYGFSPALTGVVMIVFFSSTLLTWCLVIAGGVAAAWIQHIFIVRKIPAYTFPFVVVAWTFIISVRNLSLIPASEIAETHFGIQRYWFISSIVRGYGQVIFQGSIISGVLFFIAVLTSDMRAALNGLAASLAGVILSLLNFQPIDQLQAGLFGFNAVLTAIALSMDKKMEVTWKMFGVVITIIIHNMLIDYHLLDAVGGVLTFPFVIATWITTAIRYVVNKKI